MPTKDYLWHQDLKEITGVTNYQSCKEKSTWSALDAHPIGLNNTFESLWCTGTEYQSTGSILFNDI